MAFLMLTSVIVGLAVVPNVQAQSGITSILNLQYPSQVTLQGGTAQATVTFALYYSNYYNLIGGYLVFGIWGAHSSTDIPGSATATPDPCQPAANNAGYAICEVVPSAYAGTESASFTLTFNSAQQYDLQVSAGVLDEYGNVVQGSTSYQDFTISVTGQVSTTTMSNLVLPSRALLKNGVAQATVSFTDEYANIPSGDVLAAGVADVNTKGAATGSASSTPDPCASLAGTAYANDAVCIMTPALSSGTESVSFTLTFNSIQQYNLEVVTSVEDQSHNVISGSTSKSPFTVSVTDKAQLTLTLPNSVTAAVDGANQTAGNVAMSLLPGQHTISVPETVPLTSGSQLRFDHWSDGSTTTSRTDDLENDTTLAATYVTQYSLSLTDPSASGAGWYDKGATAQFSAPPSEPAPGILGMLGATSTFQGWYENGASITYSSSGSITMNAPHTLTPQRTENDTMAMIIIVIIVVAVAAICFAVLRRKRTAGRPKSTVSPAPKAKKKGQFCQNCGAQLSPDSEFCGECGARN